MDVSYYPGCSLHGMAGEYDESIRAVCDALGVALVELEDWNCCGASSAHYVDDELAIALPARNVEIAEKAGLDVLIPCAACFQRMKHAEKELKADAGKWIDGPYEGKLEIYHVNEFFDRGEWVAKVMTKVTKKLKGLKAVPYYGCLSQRPRKVTDAEDPENPVTMDHLMRAIGIDVCKWTYKTDCCGASMPLTRPDIVQKLSGDLFEAAADAGAECLVTDCPLCQSNLDTNAADIEAARGKQYNLPVFYITELMALAMGVGDTDRWWKRHFVDPTELLRNKGLL